MEAVRFPDVSLGAVAALMVVEVVADPVQLAPCVVAVGSPVQDRHRGAGNHSTAEERDSLGMAVPAALLEEWAFHVAGAQHVVVVTDVADDEDVNGGVAEVGKLAALENGAAAAAAAETAETGVEETDALAVGGASHLAQARSPVVRIDACGDDAGT
mmetsp:Transcript_62067/g.148033  ORF Transcript_62067/g.148033 Transcript_62067/m.148033 type:complete len:157 (-) Transcript_62067:2198-2668(-)